MRSEYIYKLRHFVPEELCGNNDVHIPRASDTHKEQLGIEKKPHILDREITKSA